MSPATRTATLHGRATWSALGTTATVLTLDAERIDVAVVEVRDELADIDRAASRFRDDSDLARVNAADGRPVTVGDLLIEALDAALDAAWATGGRVDPTVGAALIELGYDRDFEAMLADPRASGPISVRRTPGARAIEIDHATRAVRVERGVKLDLGATAKALAADRAAARAAGCADTGVLVNLGGDIAVCGPVPGDGWLVRVTDDHAAPPDSPGQTIALARGGLATSSTTVRRWLRAGRAMHHIIDPRTGAPARSRWTTVSVAAPSCVRANTAATAALIMDDEAPAWLEQRALPARLAKQDGAAIAVAGWPAAGVV